jgi:hypothetical protein
MFAMYETLGGNKYSEKEKIKKKKQDVIIQKIYKNRNEKENEKKRKEKERSSSFKK